MKVNYVKTIGFRKFEKEFETKLYDITTITGGNTKGKTNILYAIVWAFLGTNLNGDERVWVGNKNSEDCYVELKFTDNASNEHTLVRYKNKYDNKKNFLVLDNKKAEPKDLQSFYSDKKLFLSILNPNYFINKQPAEQKALINQYLPLVDISTVYEKLDLSEKKYLEGVPKNITEYLKELNSTKKMYDDKIKNLNGKIEYAENVVNTVVEEKKTFEKDEELSLARQELSFLTSNNALLNKENQQKIVNNLQNQISQIEKQINDLDTKMKTGKKIYLAIKSNATVCCPTCEQKIQEESKIATIKNMKKDLEGAFDNKNKLEIDLADVKSKLMTERCKLHALEGTSNIDNEKRIAEVKTQIEKLEQEQLEVEKYNNAILIKQNNINGAKKDIETFKKQIAEYRSMIDNIKQTKDIAEKLYINYIEEKMKFATKHLKNVKIKYYSILKDSGELKEDFIINYNNNELKNLSRSETIATSIELCNMFNKISGVNLPLFIDDSESCADYDFIQDYSNDTQILIARVEKGQDLKFQDSSLENTSYLQAA